MSMSNWSLELANDQPNAKLSERFYSTICIHPPLPPLPHSLMLLTHLSIDCSGKNFQLLIKGMCRMTIYIVSFKPGHFGTSGISWNSPSQTLILGCISNTPLNLSGGHLGNVQYPGIMGIGVTGRTKIF